MLPTTIVINSLYDIQNATLDDILCCTSHINYNDDYSTSATYRDMKQRSKQEIAANDRKALIEIVLLVIVICLIVW